MVRQSIIFPVSGYTFPMKNNFIRCGICGWCLELLWTGFLSFRRREWKLTGSFFPVDVSYLRYGSFPETALKLPLQQKMFFSPAWLSIYAVYFHRRIYERKPFEKTSLLPVGLFRDTFSDKRCDPSRLCTALVLLRSAF